MTSSFRAVNFVSLRRFVFFNLQQLYTACQLFPSMVGRRALQLSPPKTHHLRLLRFRSHSKAIPTTLTPSPFLSHTSLCLPLRRQFTFLSSLFSSPFSGAPHSNAIPSVLSTISLPLDSPSPISTSSHNPFYSASSAVLSDRSLNLASRPTLTAFSQTFTVCSRRSA